MAAEGSPFHSFMLPSVVVVVSEGLRTCSSQWKESLYHYLKKTCLGHLSFCQNWEHLQLLDVSISIFKASLMLCDVHAQCNNYENECRDVINSLIAIQVQFKLFDFGVTVKFLLKFY